MNSTSVAGARTPPPEQSGRLLWFRIGLSVLSGILLGASFPPSPYGVFACFSLVPWLIVMADLRRTKPALGYSYVTFLVFHVITLNWTGGYEHGNDLYMMIAGALTMTVHPLFYFIPVSLFLFVRKGFGEKVALMALPLLWVGYEYFHSLGEWSFPWLTIGNSQSYDLAIVQCVSITGVYGLSLWILVVNVLAYVLYSSLAQVRWKFLSARSLGFTAIVGSVYFLPKLYGSMILDDAPLQGEGGLENGQKTITVGMAQPNIDPWVKWTQNAATTMQAYLAMTETMVRSSPVKPDVVLWPETAIPYRFLSRGQESLLTYLKAQVDHVDVSVLTGFPHKVSYDDPSLAAPSAKTTPGTGERYEEYNAAVFLQPGVPETPWYGKMKMVPFAERVPYADLFYRLDFLRWGVGTGGWQLGKDSTLFQENRTGTRFCTLICYESTYPSFVSAVVKRGAEFIAIITIDSWWGHMSGAFQHQQFAIFRAVENRRWIARCAVGGISGFIDPWGRMYDKTDLFTRASPVREIGRSTTLSPYARHGDWLAVAAMAFGGMFVAAALGQRFVKRKRRLEWKEE